MEWGGLAARGFSFSWGDTRAGAGDPLWVRRRLQSRQNICKFPRMAFCRESWTCTSVVKSSTLVQASNGYGMACAEGTALAIERVLCQHLNLARRKLESLYVRSAPAIPEYGGTSTRGG